MPFSALLSTPRHLTTPVGGFIFALGAMFTSGFAPFFCWPLALIAITLLYRLTIHAQNSRQAALASFVFGLGHFLTALYWIPRAFYIDAGGHWGPAVWGGIPALLAMSTALAALLAGQCALTRRVASPWQGPTFILLWLSIEFLKNLPPLSFPWNPLGSIFAGSTVMMQAASLGSVFLLSLLALISALIFSHPRRSGWLGLVLLTLQGGFGWWRLTNAPSLEAQPIQTYVRLVQGNLASAHKWNDAKRREFLHRQVALTSTDNPSVSAIIWPETAVAYEVTEDAGLRAMLARHLQPHQQLLLGFIRFNRDATSSPQAFNSFAALRPDSSLGPVYDKHILVPFGETLPFPQITKRFLRTLSFNRATYTAGNAAPNMLLTKDIRALPLICYEAAFPLYVANHIKNQQFLLNITNDNWFDGTIAPFQHFAQARLRAVETGIPLVRAANTGVSAVVDGYGRIVQQLPIQTTTARDIAVPTPVFSFFLWAKALLFI